MKGKKIVLIALSAIMVSAGVAGFAACSNGEEVSDHIINGGFEQNVDESTWYGWTREGNAFSARSVVDSTTYTENGVEKTAIVDKEGEKFFFGIGGGNSSRNTGTLTSNTFTLSGTGKIAFKMGAAKNGEKVFVEFYEKGGKTALKKVTNEDFNEPFITTHMIRKIVDLSEHLGKDIYIKVTDNDDGKDYGYVNLDDFVMCATDADVSKYEVERAAQLKKYGEPAFSETPTNTTIENGGFETGDLTNWKILEGNAFLSTNVVPTSQYYWGDRSVYGNGNYYLDGNNNGTTDEDAKGAIRSQKFTLAGDGYISFMMGAAKQKCYVAICAGEEFEKQVETEGEDGETVAQTVTVKEGDELIKVTNEYFNDPKLALTLLRRYVDASEYLGKVLYIKIVDDSVNLEGGFAFITVDDFRVSLTEQQVKDLQVEQYNAVTNETYTSEGYDDLASLKDFYNNYEYLFALEVPVFTQYAPHKVTESGTGVNLNTLLLADVTAKFATEDITDISVTKVVSGETEYTEGFDSFDLSKDGAYTVTYTAKYGDQTTEATLTLLVHSDPNQVANGGFETGNLVGWTVLTEGWGYTAGNPNGVLGADKYWGEELPYNQSGNYHLDGWNTGLDEGSTWTVRSTTFTLGGSGWITVKMGGHAAAVKVYKADGTLIGHYKQSRFADTADFPYVSKGSWADMATYAIDLSTYKGEKLYIELCDEQVEGWALAFFDEVITYYETAPDWENETETVINGHKSDDPRDESDIVEIAWVCPKNEIDRVEILNPVENKIVPEQEGYDFTALLEGVTAVYVATGTPVTDIKITQIVCGETTLENGFDSVDLTEWNVYKVTYAATYGEKTAELTFTVLVHSDPNRVANGGFETGNLAGWTVLTEGWGEVNGNPKGVISADKYWGEELPYNQGGDYHLDGWDTGIAEGATWAVRSTTFTLAGSGWITVKMGGHAAAVKVFKEDGTQIGTYAQSRFNDANFPHVGQGGSWADMATYAIDLSDYVGEKLYIELCDVEVDGWAHAFFDDVITYYETAPDWEHLYDTVMDGHKGATETEPAEEAQEIQIKWVLAKNSYNA